MTEPNGHTANSGPQYKFVGTVEREVLYGGAAGGGKSDGLLMSAAMEVKNPYHRAILIRRTFPEMKDLIRRANELYPYLGGWYRISTREWFFRGGAIIEFGYLEKDKDVLKYQGRAFNFVGWDELTQWPTDYPFRYLLSRLRAVKGSGVRLRVRATTNPGGPGHNWVKDRWRIPGAGFGTKLFDRDTGTWRVFIPARIKDNPFLSGTSYERDMDALPMELRKMLKEGRWDIVAGAMFAEFDHERHTCEPFNLPAGTTIFRGADDGYNNPACVLWSAKIDGRVYVIRELYRAGMTPEAMAEEVLKRDGEIEFHDDETGQSEPNTEALRGAIDSSAFNESGVGNSLGTGRGQVMNTLGCKWQPAQKGKGSRIAGANLVHSLLKNLPDGKPGLVIFRNCTNLIRTLPTLPKDEHNLEDVDTESEDHAYDALRYLLQFRPNVIHSRKLAGT